MYKQFLLSPQCLQKAFFIDLSKGVTEWEWVDSLPNSKIMDDKNEAAKMISVKHSKENIVGKGENAGYQHFLLSPLRFQKVSALRLLKVGIV